MDVICPRCGEPWEMDSLHEEAMARWEARHPNITFPPGQQEGNPLRVEYQNIYAQVAGEFRHAGCATLKHLRGTDDLCESTDSDDAMRASAAYGLLGDDMDGAAAMLEDWR